MLLHVVLAIQPSELEAALGKTLDKKDTMVDRVGNRRTLWPDIGRRTSDLLVISRDSVTECILSNLQNLQQQPGAPAIVILSEDTSEEDRVRLIAHGCTTILDARLPVKKLGEALNAILDTKRKTPVGTVSIPNKPTTTQLSDFVAKSPAMERFVRTLPRIAHSNSSVLILGETGVGKERLAHVLHAESSRSDGPFVAIHCGALAESLLESELFGHEQGAFTGATRARRGCFELAHQGTIFLDEIGEMPLHLQSKLLRVLENREIRRIGSEKAIIVDVRIMTATNRDLEEEVKAKQFRRDLYYRLNVVSLTIPPLRDRVEDIPELVESYVEYLSPRIGCQVSGIASKALQALCQYSWPGNVRELINVIERALLLCEGNEITCNDLPQAITETRSPLPQVAPFRSDLPGAQGVPEEWLQLPLKEARSELLKDFERRYIRDVLTATKGRIGETARRAGIDSRTLFTKMKQYNLDKQNFRS